MTFNYEPYDVISRRIGKTVTFVYEGADVAFALDASDPEKKPGGYFINGPGIDMPVFSKQGSNYHYYLRDGVGSIRMIVDINGNVVNKYTYDSFGNITQKTEGIENPFTYTGREWDAEAGLYYYRARYYDPTVGRFISEDPIGFAGGMNFYVYVENNPVNLVDPFGLDLTPAQQVAVQTTAQDWSSSKVPYTSGGTTKKGADCSGSISSITTVPTLIER